MPYKPKHPCAFPGCPELTSERFCDKHRKIDNRLYERFDRSPDVRKRYGASWRKARAAYLQAHPLCEQCLKQGRYVPAAEVHHVLPLGEGGTNCWDNLMALCKPCHSAITLDANKHSVFKF